MYTDIRLGPCEKLALTVTPDVYVQPGNWTKVAVYATQDAHLTMSGEDATVNDFFLKTGWPPIILHLDRDETLGFVRASADGSIYITACD